MSARAAGSRPPERALAILLAIVAARVLAGRLQLRHVGQCRRDRAARRRGRPARARAHAGDHHGRHRPLGRCAHGPHGGRLRTDVARRRPARVAGGGGRACHRRRGRRAECAAHRPLLAAAAARHAGHPLAVSGPRRGNHGRRRLRQRLPFRISVDRAVGRWRRSTAGDRPAGCRARLRAPAAPHDSRPQLVRDRLLSRGRPLRGHPGRQAARAHVRTVWVRRGMRRPSLRRPNRAGEGGRGHRVRADGHCGRRARRHRHQRRTRNDRRDAARRGWYRDPAERLAARRFAGGARGNPHRSAAAGEHCARRHGDIRLRAGVHDGRDGETSGYWETAHPRWNGASRHAELSAGPAVCGRSRGRADRRRQQLVERALARADAPRDSARPAQRRRRQRQRPVPRGRSPSR